MKAIEVLKQGENTSFVNKAGVHSTLKLMPPVDESDIAKMEAEIGCKLPNELRECMLYCSGFELPHNQLQQSTHFLQPISFSGPFVFSFESVFPHGFAIASDGCGNSWVVDVRKDSPEDTAVFYACHDPPVIVFQASSLAVFFRQIFALCAEPSAIGVLDRVHDQFSDQIWADNPKVLTRQESLAFDSDMKAFAESLDDTYLFRDLRKPSLGDGFSWGRYGADTNIKRFGEKRIFAYQQKELTWLQKLFGV